ncbi:MAG: OmpA family protein [Pseudomonadota bacterium]
MKLFGALITTIAVLMPGNVFGQSVNGLPLSASNCAIATALNVTLPDECLAHDLGPQRGIVIRLDSELRTKAPAPQTQDIAVSSAQVKKADKVAPKDHAAAKSDNGYFIHFAFNSFDLELEFKDHLSRLASVLNGDALATSCLRVIGHTDSSGAIPYNQNLSEKRAVIVATFLSEMGQIDPTRIQIVGKGETELLPDMQGTDARNRRVEFATKDSTEGCVAS